MMQRIMLLVALATCIVVGTARGQQDTGALAGAVTDAKTGDTIPGASVSISDLQAGAATGADGSYRIEGLPVGTYEVRARFVGYRTTTATVTIEAGETTRRDFTLREDLLELEEVVVTGQGTQVERRKLASSVDLISASEIEDAPVTSVDQLLQGRVAGSTVRAQSAQPGQASVINLRGITSLFSDQTPVIYVDGVRVDNSNNTSFSFGGESTSALSELLVSDIERIEVTKGGAASTLYGNDSANGVIQIFTQKGEAGPPQVKFRTEQGVNFPVSRYFRDTGFSFSESVNDSDSPNFGRDSFIEDEYLKTGQFQNYYLGVSGGTDQVVYNVSGRVQDGDGIQPKNDNTIYALRGNLNTSVSEAVNVQFSGSYTRSQFERLNNGVNIADPLTALEVGDAMFFTGTNSLEDALDVFLLNSIEEGVDRFTLSFAADYAPVEWFNSKLTVGVDSRTNEQRIREPAAADILNGNDNGMLTRFNRDFRSVTLEYRGTFTNSLTDNLTSDLTFGVQGFRDVESIVFADAEGFGLPGQDDIGAAGRVTADEFQQEVFNGGFYLRERLGYGDRLFLTGGVRFDGNSSFGDEVGLEVYPSIGLAYTISDESFWNVGTLVNDLKLRASFGQTGNFPPAQTKDFTLESEPFRGESAPRFDNPGNQNLAPERTSTFEGGIESVLFDDRIGVDFTAYLSRTTQGLFPVPEQPSTGGDSQFRNVYEVENRGIELSVDARILATSRFNWSVAASWAYDTNEVLELNLADFTIGGSDVRAQQRVTVGRPVGVWRATTPIDSNGDGLLDSSEFQFTGETPYPTHTGSFSTSVLAFNNLSIRALADWSAGAQVFDWGSHWSSFNGLVRADRPEKFDLDGNPVDGDGDGEQDLFTTTEAGRALLQDADFLTLREVTVSYRLPTRLTDRLNLQGAMLFATGRNLWKFTRQELVDPELAGLNDSDPGDAVNITLGGAQSITLSPPRQFRLGLELRF